MIAASKHRLHLFDGSKLVASFSDEDSSSKYFKSSYLEHPMGYFWMFPDYDKETNPFLLCSCDQSINMVNLKEKTVVPFIICEQTCSWG